MEKVNKLSKNGSKFGKSILRNITSWKRRKKRCSLQKIQKKSVLQSFVEAQKEMICFEKGCFMETEEENENGHFEWKEIE